MSEVTKETFEWAYKPFDIVTDNDNSNNVGFIQEVSVNECQESPEHQISYAVRWFIGDNSKHAWFDNDDLTVCGNIFVLIAESACHPFGQGENHIKQLFSNIK